MTGQNMPMFFANLMPQVGSVFALSIVIFYRPLIQGFADYMSVVTGATPDFSYLEIAVIFVFVVTILMWVAPVRYLINALAKANEQFEDETT
jgi:hypothetical protein